MKRYGAKAPIKEEAEGRVREQTNNEVYKEVFYMKPKELVSADEAEKIAIEACIYGYPLVLMDVTKKVSTSVPKVEGQKAPVNQFTHLQEFPDYTFTDVVSPNADTLYSVAWLDLAKEPIVLSLPDVGKRYYLMEMVDAWTNVFASPVRGPPAAVRGTSPSPGQPGPVSFPLMSKSSSRQLTRSG